MPRRTTTDRTKGRREWRDGGTGGNLDGPLLGSWLLASGCTIESAAVSCSTATALLPFNRTEKLTQYMSSSPCPPAPNNPRRWSKRTLLLNNKNRKNQSRPSRLPPVALDSQFHYRTWKSSSKYKGSRDALALGGQWSFLWTRRYSEFPAFFVREFVFLLRSLTSSSDKGLPISTSTYSVASHGEEQNGETELS